jgi:palmitoyltransferase ZDHHC6
MHLYLLTYRSFGPLAFTTEPSVSEVILIILNYTLCVPVLLAVGVFACYHAYAVWTNTTTIEAWEKDRVATLIRRGEIREVSSNFV